MRKLVFGTLLLALATTTVQAADLREPYGPPSYGPGPRAYAPPAEPEDEPTPEYRPVPPRAYGPPPAQGYRDDGAPLRWREGGWRDGWREGHWQGERWRRPEHRRPDCWWRPTPWGPERVCR